MAEEEVGVHLAQIHSMCHTNLATLHSRIAPCIAQLLDQSEQQTLDVGFSAQPLLTQRFHQNSALALNPLQDTVKFREENHY